MTTEAEKQQYTEQVMTEFGKGLNDVIKETFGPEWGFTFILFKFEDPGKLSNYVSNAKREDMIKALRETADRLEKRSDIPPSPYPAQ